jgi:hypothetical protein
LVLSTAADSHSGWGGAEPQTKVSTDDDHDQQVRIITTSIGPSTTSMMVAPLICQARRAFDGVENMLQGRRCPSRRRSVMKFDQVENRGIGPGSAQVRATAASSSKMGAAGSALAGTRCWFGSDTAPEERQNVRCVILRHAICR